MTPILRWIRARREAASLTAELEHHRALIQADLESRGVPVAESAAESRRAMGNVTLAREEARDAWVSARADQLLRDARYGIRALRHEPTFALTSILTLALGVGMTTAVFSLADSELWKPLPYPHPEQLVGITSSGPGEHVSTDGISGADLLDWRAAATAFSDLAMGGSRIGRQVLHLRTAESVVVSEVTANYFATLGQSAVAGRTFDQRDARGARMAVVTDRAWQRLFAGDPAILGRPVTLDDEPITIVGVVLADDSLGVQPDLFVSLDEAAAAFLDRSRPIDYGVIGRLRPGVGVEQARAQLQAAATRLAETRGTGRADHRIEIDDLRKAFAGYNWRPLYFFVGASLMVLLLSAVNVATLLVSRAIRRQREFALRSALGGSRGPLTRQLLVEGALLAVPGGALGILIASWILAILVPALPPEFLARGSHIPLDLRVGAFTVAATALATLVFALLPLPLARRLSASAMLRDGGRSGQTANEGRARSVLLCIQIALTVVLLAGAAIFLKSFIAVSRIPLGFDALNLAVVHVALSGPRYESDSAVRQYTERLVENVRAVPGARTVTIATSSPLGSGPLTFFIRPDRPRPAAGEETRVILRAVEDQYFRTVGIPLLRGRDFSPVDAAGAPRVAIVNATLVKQMFGADEAPLGQFVELLPSRAPWTRRPGQLQIIGIAGNAKEVGMNEVDMAAVYVPFRQMPSTRFELIVRTETSPAGLIAPLRAAAARTDPDVPILSATTFGRRVDAALQGPRLNALLVGGFAFIAILLSAIGVYGVASYQVQARGREFGIRLALGALPAALVRAALFRTGRLAGIGAAFGLAATVVTARLLGNALYLVPGAHQGLLYGVTTTDPAMLTSALAGIMIVAVAAAAIPTRQITRVDPATALRSE
jgi:putative ABC transport system permease protein